MLLSYGFHNKCNARHGHCSFTWVLHAPTLITKVLFWALRISAKEPSPIPVERLLLLIYFFKEIYIGKSEVHKIDSNHLGQCCLTRGSCMLVDFKWPAETPQNFPICVLKIGVEDKPWLNTRQYRHSSHSSDALNLFKVLEGTDLSPRYSL